MKIRTALVALAIASCGAPAYSQQQAPLCGPAIEMLPAFASEYGETPLMTGLSASGFVLTIVVNPSSGTWSAFRVTPEGIACLLDVGEGARLFQPATPGEPS